MIYSLFDPRKVKAHNLPSLKIICSFSLLLFYCGFLHMLVCWCIFRGANYVNTFNNFLCVIGYFFSPIGEKMEPHRGIMKAFPTVKRAKVLHGKDTPPAKKKPDECDVTGCYQNRKVKLYIWPLTIVQTHIFDNSYSCIVVSYSVLFQEVHLLASQHISCLPELDLLDTKSSNDK